MVDDNAEDESEIQVGDPDSEDAFGAAVGKIRLGRADALPVLDVRSDIERFRKLDPSILPPFFERARIFLGKVVNTATERHSEPEKTASLSEMFNTDFPRNEKDYVTEPLNIQIMNLGALVFVGESTEAQRHRFGADPKRVESVTVTAELGKLGNVKLGDSERRLTSALATGTEVGYGDKAGGKFRELVTSIRTHTQDRTATPQQVGDDFIEALLTTNL